MQNFGWRKFLAIQFDIQFSKWQTLCCTVFSSQVKLGKNILANWCRFTKFVKIFPVCMIVARSGEKFAWLCVFWLEANNFLQRKNWITVQECTRHACTWSVSMGLTLQLWNVAADMWCSCDRNQPSWLFTMKLKCIDNAVDLALGLGKWRSRHRLVISDGLKISPAVLNVIKSCQKPY